MATRERLETLRQHVEDFSADINETLAFTDAESSEALEAITTRRPRVIIIDQLFAASSRGALVIACLKADPTLAAPEITVVSPEGRVVRLSTKTELYLEPPPRNRSSVSESTSSRTSSPGVNVPPPPLSVDNPAPLFEHTFIRRAPRVQLRNTLRVQLDGTAAMPIDLSVTGAQAQSSNVLRPGQRVRMTLGDEVSTLRLSARVAWASYERPKGNPAPFYRVGMEFTDADPAAIQAFCDRHGQVALQAE